MINSAIFLLKNSHVVSSFIIARKSCLDIPIVILYVIVCLIHRMDPHSWDCWDKSISIFSFLQTQKDSLHKGSTSAFPQQYTNVYFPRLSPVLNVINLLFFATGQVKIVLQSQIPLKADEVKPPFISLLITCIWVSININTKFLFYCVIFPISLWEFFENWRY